MPKVPLHRQLDAMDCGPTCVRMVAGFYGRHYALDFLREHAYLDREGVSLAGIRHLAETIGLEPMAVRIPFRSDDPDAPGLTDAPLPAIVHWDQNHFVVVENIGKRSVTIADPKRGRVRLPRAEFNRHWRGDNAGGVALLLSPTDRFYELEGHTRNRRTLWFLLRYLTPYRRLLWQLLLGVLVLSAVQLVLPFLTQAVVDVGITNQDLDFIYLVLAAQLMLFVAQTTTQFLQNWILLHVGTRVNVHLLHDFLYKLMRLPIAFFDKKMTGDLLQRIADHKRIELFLTTTTLRAVFSVFTFVVFGCVLLYYSWQIFAIYLVATVLYFLWVQIFLPKRAQIDLERFEEAAESQNVVLELIRGMPEIKLQNSDRRHRQKWQGVQARLFRTSLRATAVVQYQDAGTAAVLQLKDVLITFIAARAVIEGDLTLGMMLAIFFIIGQLNVPLQQMVLFIRAAQDARISLERLGEIHEREEEETPDLREIPPPEAGDLVLENVHFAYNPLSEPVLKDVQLTIPHGKTTAIVGASGSGKTTLVKLLLGFYEPDAGRIRVGNVALNALPRSAWRARCGAVLQDGYVFSDTIARNVAESEPGRIDGRRLQRALETACLTDFLERLPQGYRTMVGARGNGLSQGQRQRLLIARAVYKNPDYLFFDEATNALDATNERRITEHLNRFLENRTAVVVAHRLSTVKHADQIVVLDRGQIVERGTHSELTASRGAYYTLVREQLELGA